MDCWQESKVSIQTHNAHAKHRNDEHNRLSIKTFQKEANNYPQQTCAWLCNYSKCARLGDSLRLDNA